MHATSPLRAVLLGATIVALAGCTSDSPVAPAPVPQSSIVITPVATALFERDVVTLHAVVRDGDGRDIPNASIQWSTADTTIVEVTASGLVIAMKPGTARVTARSGGLTSTLTLPISRLTVSEVLVLGVPDTLASGDVALFGVRVRGDGGRDVFGRRVTLASSNPAVALIDPSGRVRAIGPGSATISATADGVTGVSKVVVAAGPAILTLRDLGSNRLPTLIDADSVDWNGVREYVEVYLESGRLQLTGGSTPRYVTEMHYAQYAVSTVGGQRRMVLRAAWDDRDRGLVNYDARGDLALSSEVTWPLAHQASGISNGIAMQYRLAGTNDVLSLFFRREPE